MHVHVSCCAIRKQGLSGTLGMCVWSAGGVIAVALADQRTQINQYRNTYTLL